MYYCIPEPGTRLSAELALAAAVVAAHELHGEALAREKRPRARAPGEATSTGCDLTDAALATALAATSEPVSITYHQNHAVSRLFCSLIPLRY